MLALAMPATAQDRDEARPTVRAVVVGVAGYTQTGIAPLLGAYNDAMLVSDTLLRSGTDSQNITLLADRPTDEMLAAKNNPQLRESGVPVTGKGTRDNILGALKRLVERTQPGDEILISFSGHGFQQLDDEDGEEPDGLDEIFLPYDTQPSEDGKTLDRAITDDEIGAVIDAIRTRGGNVTYIGDFCHSGDSNRGVGEGEDPSILPDQKALKLDLAKANIAKVGTGGIRRDLAVETKQDGAGMGSYVGMMAAPSDTQAHERPTPYFASYQNRMLDGLLTAYAMLNMSNPRVYSYRDLASRVNNGVDGHRGAPRPLFDGDLDRPILGGVIRTGAAPSESWTVVKPQTDSASYKDPVRIESLELSAGELNGLVKDAVVGLSTVTDEGETTILYGKVAEIGAYKAKLVPTSFGDIEASAWDDVRDYKGRPMMAETRLIATVAQQPVPVDFTIALPRLRGDATPVQKATVAALKEIDPKTIGATFVSSAREADLVLKFGEVATGEGDRLLIDEPVGTPSIDFGRMDVGALYSEGGDTRRMRYEVGTALVRAAKFYRLRKLLSGIGLDQEEGDDPAKLLDVEFYVERPAPVAAGAECPASQTPFYQLGTKAKPLEGIGQDETGRFALQRCDMLLVRIHNKSDRELYVNPLIFSPDGSILLMQPKAANPTRFAANEEGVIQYELIDARADGLLRDDLVILVSEATDGTAVSFAKLEQCPVVPGPEDSSCASTASLGSTKMRSAGDPGSPIEQLIDSALDGGASRSGTVAKPARTGALRYSWQTMAE